MSEPTLAPEAGNATEKALTIRVHDGDNVAIVVNARGLPAGTALADGTVLVEGVPQGHKVALVDLAEGDAIIPVSYTHLTLPTKEDECRSRWSPYH